jgi:hypothetical protein
MLFGGFNRLFLKLVAGTTYYFQVGGYVGAKGDLVFNVVPFDGPANNNFANAIPIASFPFKDSLNNLGATVEPGEPSPSCAPGGGTVWYSFTPTADMRIVADTFGSSFSAVLAAFAGTAFANLQPLGCQAFSTPLVLDVTAGTTYYFQIGGYSGAVGELVFNVVAHPRPTNDNFANATRITALPFTDSLSAVGATTELGEPSPSCGRVSHTVWYSFTPAVDMTIAMDTAGSNVSTVITAFVGNDFGTLQPLGCQGFGRFFVDLTAGTTYHFQLGGQFGSLTANLVFNMAPFVRPANDDFANATVIGSLPFADTLSTEGTTGEPGEVNAYCAITANSSVWYSFTPTADMSIAIDTLGSNFNTAVGVYTGRTLADLQPIGCKSFDPRLIVDLRAGATYYFQVGGWSGQTGHLVFNVAPFTRFALGLSINPTGTVVRSTGIATVTGVVTCSKPASVNLRGSVSQRMGRGVISGSFLVSMPCDGPTPWKADVASDGSSFGGGNADVSLSAFAFTPDGEGATVELSTTVRLQSIR